MKSTTFISALFASGALAQSKGILFAAKVNGELRHLYGESVDDAYNVLGYSNSPFAQTFNLDGVLAYTGKDEAMSFLGQVGSKWMGFGKDSIPFSFEFDENNKVINRKFYGCAGLAGEGDHKYNIFTTISYDADTSPGCTPVDIYKVPLLL